MTEPLLVSVDSFADRGSSTDGSDDNPRQPLVADEVRDAIRRTLAVLEGVESELSRSGPSVRFRWDYSESNEIPTVEFIFQQDGRSELGMAAWNQRALILPDPRRNAQGGAACWDTDPAIPGTEECDIAIFSGRRSLGAGPGAIDDMVYNPWAVPGPPVASLSADGSHYIYTQYDFESVLLHELGHGLGLSHTSLPKSMMTPSIDLGELLAPSCDDKRALLFLYCDGVGEVSCDDDVVASYWCPDDERP